MVFCIAEYNSRFRSHERKKNLSETWIEPHLRNIDFFPSQMLANDQHFYVLPKVEMKRTEEFKVPNIEVLHTQTHTLKTKNNI